MERLGSEAGTRSPEGFRYAAGGGQLVSLLRRSDSSCCARFEPYGVTQW
jgi:hypothetical protein